MNLPNEPAPELDGWECARQVDVLDELEASVISDALRHARMTWRTEIQLQDEVSRILTGAGVRHEREVELSAADRIDFLAGKVGVEVKIKGSASAVARQLQRYAHSDRVTHLLLVTTRPHHAAGMPSRLAGVPVDVVTLTGGAW